MRFHTLALAVGLSLLAGFPAEAHSRTETRTEALKAGGSLLVRTANSPISVQGWDREEVAVTAEIQDDASHPVKVEYRRREGRLEVEAVFPEHSGGWFFHGGQSCAFKLQVPRKLLAELRTSNASVSARDLDGSLVVRTSNASVSLEELAGAIEARTSNGSVKAKNLKAGLRGSTSNASLRFENVQGAIDFQTSNGSVFASGLDGWGQGISLQTSNGQITAELGQATGQIDARTSHHEKVKVERQGLELVEMAKGHVRLKIPGREQAIELRTSNGSITIR